MPDTMRIYTRIHSLVITISAIKVKSVFIWLTLKETPVNLLSKSEEINMTKKGVGFSTSAVAQLFPEGKKGFNYVLSTTWDEIFKSSVTPQIGYWFGNGFKTWVAYNWESEEQDSVFLQFQWDI